MLLRRLAEYARHLPDLPPPYYRLRRVQWALRLDRHGRRGSLISLVDTERPHGVLHKTPYIYRSGTKPAPFLISDTLEFVLAVPKDDTQAAREEAARRNDTYIALLRDWKEHAPDDPIAAAVVTYFDSRAHLGIQLPQEAKASHSIVVFVEETPAQETDSAIAFWQQVVRQRKSASSETAICSSCGRTGPVLGTFPESVRSGAIPVASGRGRDAQLVSINKQAQGRGGTVQLANTPVCDDCGGQSIATLNALLADDDHRYRGEDSVTVWWLQHPSTFNLMRSVRDAQPADVRYLYDEVEKARSTHAAVGLDTNQFYALVLSTNEGRVVVRDWIDVPLHRAVENVKAWFDDHSMVALSKDGRHCVPLWRLHRALGRWDRKKEQWVKDTAPHSADRLLLTCAFRGRSHRPSGKLLQHLIARIRADHHVDLDRAALVRFLLIRRDPGAEGKPMPELDPTHRDPAPPAAYQWGRLFAIFESIQYTALTDPQTRQGPNTTIADKFLGTAMTRPQVVFPMLRRGASNHLKRLRRDNSKACTALNQRLDEVLALVEDPLPMTLDLEGQGWFVLGYHHQRAADRSAARAAKEAQTSSPRDEGEAA